MKKSFICMMILLVFVFTMAISDEYDAAQTFLSVQEPSVGDLVQLGYLERAEGGVTRGLDIVKNTLFSPTQTSNGLVVINVADPENPFEVGSAPSAGPVSDVVIRDNLAYLTGPNGLRILEFSVDNPDNPTSFSGTVIGELNLGEPTLVIVVQDDYAYTHINFTFFIIDISDPMNPQIAGSLYLGSDFGYIFGLDVEKNIAVLQHDQALGIGGNGRISIIDIADPSNPSLIVTEVISGCGLMGNVDIKGKLAFVSGLGRGLEIWDISNPSDPNHLGSADVPCSTDVQVRGCLAYVTGFDWNCVASIDISDPSAPVVLDTEYCYWPIGITSNKDGLVFTAGIDRVTVYSVVLPLPNIDVDIKANGSDGPITITHSDALSLTVDFDSGCSLGEEADWWVLMRTSDPPPNKWYYFDMPTRTWMLGRYPTRQGSLFDLSDKKVPKTSGLAPGIYTFFFAVDMAMNGSIDVSQAYYDKVKVTITP